MNETSKSHARRLKEGFYERYCKGRGLDIGCGSDPIANADGWDLEQGDATYLATIPDEHYNFVYSSHCLEHLSHPEIAHRNWWRVLEPNGYLILIVPDEDLYEQTIWPSRFNGDHRSTWTIDKTYSWSPVSNNLLDAITILQPRKVLYVKTIDDGYDYTLRQTDQTLGNAEAAIEAVIRKLPPRPTDGPQA